MADNFTKTVTGYNGHDYELKVLEQTGVINDDAGWVTGFTNTITGDIDGTVIITQAGVLDTEIGDQVVKMEESLKTQIDAISNQAIYDLLVGLGFTKD